MSHSIRFAPPGEFLAEISQRCLLGHFLLRPSEKLNQLVAGVVAKATRKYPVKVVALAVPSNHYHLLVTATSQQDVSKFMNFLASNVAREAGELYGWKGRFWASRYRCSPVTDENEAQVARLKYVLSQGSKDGLVSSPRSWPGLNSARAQMTGKAIRGTWVDRTGLYRARRTKNGRKARLIDFQETLTVDFAPLPCWAHLSVEAQQERVRSLVEEIETETAAMHRAAGSRPMGRRAVRRTDPHSRPAKNPRRSPVPRVHAASRAARERYLEAYRSFVRAYRHASERFRNGELTVLFPEGSFPPARPFVPRAQPG